MINGKGVFTIASGGIVTIALIGIIVAIFFFLFLGNGSLSNSSSSSSSNDAIKNRSAPYIELKYDEWTIDPLNVYIIVNEIEEISRRYNKRHQQMVISIKRI